MWLSLFTVVLILTITFFQGLQGLFSALITCVLTVLAAGLAFGFYEDLYFAQLIQYQPDHGRAIALMAIFFLSLLILRVLFDILIQGNMQFPLYVDRIGGGVLGFMTAMLMVGMLAIGLQMLPFGPSFLSFTRYALVDENGQALAPDPEDKNSSVQSFRANLDWSHVRHRRRNIWLNPDGFTAAFMSHLSDNALQGQNRLSRTYPDLLRSMYNARSSPYRASRHTVNPNAMRVTGYWDMPPKSFYIRQQVEVEGTGRRMNKALKLVLDEEPVEPGLKMIVVRAGLDIGAADSDRVHRFTTEQFRLVAMSRRDGPTEEYFLAGINFEQAPRWIRLYRGECVNRNPQGSMKLDLVFEVPDRPEFKPLFLEYKQNARVAFRASMNKNEEKPPPLAPESQTKTPGRRQPGRPGDRPPPAPPPGSNDNNTNRPGAQAPPTPSQGRISSLGPARKESTFGDRLPFTLTDYGGSEIAVSDGTLRGARQLYAELNGDWTPLTGNRKPIQALEVPDGSRLLQLSVEKLQPQSWLGQIYGGIIGTVRDFYLIDESGKEYMPVGSYAMAVVSGKAMFELIYLDESARGFARLPKFKRIRPEHMKGNYALYFLFHVPPGTRAVKVHTGRKDVDLREFDLVAPQ